jgi:HEAT repeat protein
LGGERAVDWHLWTALLNSSEPAPTRAERIPSSNRDAYISALISALSPDTTYTRPMQGGETWRGRFTPEQRLSAISLLGALRERRAAAPLTQLLNDPSNHVRIAVIMALGWIGGAMAVTALAQMLDHSHEPSRAEAARWLGWSGSPAAREPLADALSDTASGVRLAAAKALSRLDDPRAFGPLIEAFWRSRGLEHNHILSELRRYDLDRTISVLIQARCPEDPLRCEVATRALHSLRTQGALAGRENYDHRATGNFDDA